MARRHGLSTERWADSGKYKYDNTNAWWECWRSAREFQPAQAVDVGAIREVIAELTKEYGLSYPFEIRCANKLHRAISNAPTPLREWDVPYEDYIRTLKTT